jgi:hypothetical protein
MVPKPARKLKEEDRNHVVTKGDILILAQYVGCMGEKAYRQASQK